MPDGHTSPRRFYGRVWIGDRDIGLVFCELTVDEYRPRAMRIVVHVPEETSESVEFWTADLTRAIKVEGSTVVVESKPGLSTYSDNEGERISARVETVTTTQFWHSNDFAFEHRYNYSFPLTGVTQGKGRFSKYGMSGLVRSQRGITESDGIQSFKPVEPLTVTLDGVELRLGMGFDFASGGDARYPEQTLTQLSSLSFTIQTGSEDAPQRLARDTATLSFTLDETSRVRVSVYDILGREVGVAYDATADEGVQQVSLDTGALSAGAYVVRIVSGGGADAVRATESIRLTVIR